LVGYVFVEKNLFGKECTGLGGCFRKLVFGKGMAELWLSST